MAEVEASLASSQKGEPGKPDQVMATGKGEAACGQFWVYEVLFQRALG